MTTTLKPVEASGAVWREMIENWPKGLAKTGVMLTAFDESIPFSSFMTNRDTLLLERKTPDSLGARMVIVAYDQIIALKITAVVPEKHFREMGFSGKLSKK